MEKDLKRFLDSRKNEYGLDVRSRFVLFRELIHDKIRAGKVKCLTTPLSVFWAITGSCNFNCKHCYANNISHSDIDLACCFKIIDQLETMKVLDITFEGGEPFYREDFIDILKYAKNKKFVIDILSNGSLITKELSQKLEYILNKDIDRIQISLDGDEKANDNIRGDGNYIKTIDGIVNLQRYSDLKNITINTVITSENIFSIDRMCKDLVNYTNIKIVHLSPLMAIGKGIEVNKPDLEIAISIFLNLVDKYRGKIQISGTPVLDSDLYFSECFSEYRNEIMECFSKSLFGCCAGRSKIYINSNGVLSPCTFLCKKYLKIDISEFSIDSYNYDWECLIENSYKNSMYMKNENTYLKYCPALFSDDTSYGG